jgi:hypothetical protein
MMVDPLRLIHPTFFKSMEEFQAGFFTAASIVASETSRA